MSIIPLKTIAWLRRSGFNPRAVYVAFLVDNMTLERILL
jgi:hypothetical protein